MKKRILCLAMAAIMAVGIHTTAFAETLQGGSDWKVEFNGSKMSSNFTSADMKKDILHCLQMLKTARYSRKMKKWYGSVLSAVTV